MSSASTNKAKLHAASVALFDLEAKVLENKANEYVTRSTVVENQDLIKRNFVAAFNGNRQFANANTDSAFRAKIALLKSAYHGDDQVRLNHVEALAQRGKIDAIEHRSKLNEKVNSISVQLAALNTQLIEINRQILDANEEVVLFNSKVIADTNALAETVKKSVEGATPEGNAAIITENEQRIAAITKRAEANKTKDAEVQTTAVQNRGKIEANSQVVYQQRAKMEANAKALHQLQAKVKTLL